MNHYEYFFLVFLAISRYFSGYLIERIIVSLISYSLRIPHYRQPAWSRHNQLFAPKCPHSRLSEKNGFDWEHRHERLQILDGGLSPTNYRICLRECVIDENVMKLTFQWSYCSARVFCFNGSCVTRNKEESRGLVLLALHAVFKCRSNYLLVFWIEFLVSKAMSEGFMRRNCTMSHALHCRLDVARLIACRHHSY